MRMCVDTASSNRRYCENNNTIQTSPNVLQVYTNF